MSRRAEKIGRLAKDALVFEARLSPKPGLVDAENSGSHTDMDLGLLLASAGALEPFFVRFAETGKAEASLDPVGRIFAIRLDGLEAERAMLAVTGGVNTHKGAIFLLGLLCYAAGRLDARGEPLSPARVAGVGGARLPRRDERAWRTRGGAPTRATARAAREPRRKRGIQACSARR